MRHRLAAVVGLLALVAAACGDHDDHTSGANDSAARTRTVRIEMRDTTYSPANIEVRTGETVRFVFTNKSTVPHDAFVGDKAAQTAHEAEMRADGGEHHHGGDGVTVEPGKTADLTETFEEAGTSFVGCHEPGHWDAGMKITVTVA